MCGFYGIVQRGDNPDLEERARVQRDRMAHRGPDDAGLFLRRPDGASPWTVAFGHRRLAIIDLSPGGHQPMSGAGGALTIVYNGEIYNYRELRRELEAEHGCRFATRSDTEVLLQGYERWGAGLEPRLNGMWAFAIWDAQRDCLVLSRDRFGEKPLHYRLDADGIAFSSEIAALARDPGTPGGLDLEALDDYLTWGYVPGPRTAWAAIRKLPAATRMTWSGGTVQSARYWDVPAVGEGGPGSAPAPRDGREAEEGLRDALDRAVRSRLVADVPVGLFLSGGLDSSAVALSMTRAAAGRVKSFSIGFQEADWDESGAAKQVAAFLGTEHRDEIVAPDALEILPRLVEHYGEPFADTSAIPMFYLARMTARHVKVALSGDGGDESLGGYRRYLAIRLAASLPRLPEGAVRGISGLLRPAAPDRNGRLHSALRFLEALPHPGWQRAARWMVLFGPEHRDALLGPDLAAAAARRSEKGESPEQRLAALLTGAKGRDAVDRAMSADLGFYLVDDLMVKADIAAMASSLESRAPLIDHAFVEFAARLPARLKVRGLTTKRILRRAMRGHLPAEILKRGKRGFGVPIGRWMRGPLAGLVRESLLGGNGARPGGTGLVGPVLRRDGVERLWSEHAAGTADHGERLWALLLLVLWHRRFVEGGDLDELTRRAARP